MRARSASGFLALAALGLGFLGGWSAPARACSCAELAFADLVAQADLVAEVEVLRVDPIDPAIEADAASNELRVIRRFKGPAAEGGTIVVAAGTAPAAGGIPFLLGERYLLVAYLDEAGEWRTGTCSRTRPMRRAGKELAILEAEGP